MTSDAPPFWWKKPDWRAFALSPLSLLYGGIAARRLAKGARIGVGVPVICVGNFTIGGAGKTPTVLSLVEVAQSKGLTPGILSRGYGGSLDRTTMVDPDLHRARDVGDEPLLLARKAMTAISRNRVEGAKLLIAHGADIIVMDDGFQSARLAIDFALVVIDSHRGVGNGFIIPAGPVRAPLRVQLAYTTALLKVGDGEEADTFVRRAARAGKAVYTADIVARPYAGLAGRKVMAFAGIADPEKFYRTVSALGMEIVAQRSFGDHHALRPDEVKDILSTASRDSLTIVTTAKDYVRLADPELMDKVTVIEVDMVFEAPATPSQIIDQAVDNAKNRIRAPRAR